MNISASFSLLELLAQLAPLVQWLFFVLVPSPHVSLFMKRNFNDQFSVIFLIVMSFEQTINMMM